MDVPNPLVGQVVEFIDEDRQVRDALVVYTWDNSAYGQAAGVNLVIVVKDPNQKDDYGRKTEHRSSVVHESAQPAARGFCWRHKKAVA